MLAGPARARAQTASPPPVALEWNVPSGCPTAPEVLKRILKLAHVWPPTGTPLRAAATITPTQDEQLHLRLIVYEGGLVGERNIEAKACANLASATAIHIALLLNQSTPLRERDLSSPDQTSNTNGTTGETAGSPTSASQAEPSTAESESLRDESAAPSESSPEPTHADNSTRTWRVRVRQADETRVLGSACEIQRRRGARAGPGRARSSRAGCSRSGGSDSCAWKRRTAPGAWVHARCWSAGRARVAITVDVTGAPGEKGDRQHTVEWEVHAFRSGARREFPLRKSRLIRQLSCDGFNRQLPLRVPRMARRSSPRAGLPRRYLQAGPTY